jgi:hypothetical protein
MTKRAQPLAAAPAASSPPLPPSFPGEAPPADPFAEEVRTLRVGSARVQLSERILLVLGGIIAPLGLVVVLLGWWGASRTPFVFEQVPYLISGGVLGLGLVFLGSFFYFTHWVTQLVKEHRVQSRALLDAIGGLRDEVARLEANRPASGRSAHVAANGHGPAAASDAPVDLVATERGSMAHRRECVVVAGKSGTHVVQPDDGLRACKLCDPYAVLDHHAR